MCRGKPMCLPEAQECGEGKNQRQGTMPCDIRPIVVDTPQTA